MTRLGSYWLLFLIVAVGLALSWGQVGRKTDRIMQAEPVVYLVNESDCRPRAEPCAAMARDRALVLGPAPQGLALRQTGLQPPDVVGVEVLFLDERGGVIGQRALALEGSAWLLREIPVTAHVLRVRLSGNREATVGEFPLR